MHEDKPPILVAGVGPMPPEMPDRLFAPGLRLWGMARELIRAGHRVRLVSRQFGGETAGHRYDLVPGQRLRLHESLPLRPAAESDWPPLLAHLARQAGVAAAAATTDVMNHALALSGLEVPLWMDYNGDPMAERQMMAMHAGNDEGLAQQWDLMVPALARADRLSGCSTQQCAALLGQLGAIGRLNRHTATEQLVHRMTPWLEALPVDVDAEGPFKTVGVPDDAFVVLQTGGFNTWLDVETLFDALERAMEGDPSIHFAATGGAIPGHHATAFKWFERAVAASRFRHRYHLLGWLPLGQVPRVMHEAHLGLNLDLACPEGWLGCRNRVIAWVLGGLPVVTTPGCELVGELAADGMAELTPHGDGAAAAERILAAARRGPPRPGERRERTRYMQEHYDASRCLEPFLKWAAQPKPASDLQAWTTGAAAKPGLLMRATETARWDVERRRQAQKLGRLQQKLDRLQGSRWVRLALRLRGRHGMDT